jgi:hypothetical protein
MWNGVRFVLAVSILSAAGPLAGADTLHIGEHAQVTLVGVNAGVKSMTFHYGGATITDFVGEYAWKPATTPSTNPWPLNQPFESFCVDLNEFVQLNRTYDYTIKTLETSPNPDPQSPAGMGADRADALRRLWGTYRAGAQTNDMRAAAFQMAIWEIVFETTPSLNNPLPKLDVTKGSLYMDTIGSVTGKSGASITLSSIATEANKYLYNVYNSIGTSYEPNLVVLSMPNGQDQLVVMPVPAAACGGTALLGLLAGFRRRRGQQLAGTAD